MSGGTISGNSCTSSSSPDSYGSQWLEGAFGGGVFIQTPASMLKTGGIIYGNEVTGNDAGGIPLRNMAQTNNHGHAVLYRVDSGYLRRNTTAYAANNMNSSVSGSAGGWE